jgi:hypothetical protein
LSLRRRHILQCASEIEERELVFLAQRSTRKLGGILGILPVSGSARCIHFGDLL